MSHSHSDNDLDGNTAKQLSAQQTLLTNFVQTEQQYVDSLEALREHVVDPLANRLEAQQQLAAQPVQRRGLMSCLCCSNSDGNNGNGGRVPVTQEEFTQMFGHLHAVVGANRELLATLKEHVDSQFSAVKEDNIDVEIEDAPSPFPSDKVRSATLAVAKVGQAFVEWMPNLHSVYGDYCEGVCV